MLLGPVVEVPLDTAPLRVRRRDDARPRDPQLVGLPSELIERGLERRSEPDIVQGQPDLLGERGQQALVLAIKRRGFRRALDADHPQQLARMRDRRRSDFRRIPAGGELRQPDFQPRGADDARAREGRFLGRRQDEVCATRVRIRGGPLEQTARPGPDLGGVERQRTSQRFGEL